MEIAEKNEQPSGKTEEIEETPGEQSEEIPGQGNNEIVEEVDEEEVEETLEEETEEPVEESTEETEEVTEEEVEETLEEEIEEVIEETVEEIEEAAVEEIEQPDEPTGEELAQPDEPNGEQPAEEAEEADDEDDFDEEAYMAWLKENPDAVPMTLMMPVMLSETASEAEAKWDPDNGKYAIGTLENLLDFANRVNGKNGYTAFTFEGETVTLNADIDLAGIDNWTPIGNGSRSGTNFSGNSFKGIFDGQGHTISNLTIISGSGDVAVGFFGVVNGARFNDHNEEGGVVRNLVIENANINTPGNELAGAAVGYMVNNATVQNVTVQSGSVVGLKGVGGVIGRMTVCGVIENCVNNATVTATGTNGSNVGGIVGAAYYTNCNEMFITNCTNNGDITGDNGVGGIVGLSAANVSGCTNNGNVVDRANGAAGGSSGVGGIVGEQDPYGYIKNCTNTGTVTNYTSNDAERLAAYGTGGIVGWVRYANAANKNAYLMNELIEVSGNINTGNVYGGNDGGGIIGCLYNAGLVTDNVNEAAYLEGGRAAAGIVGSYQSHEKPPVSFEYPNTIVGNNRSKTTLDEISVVLHGYENNKRLYIYWNPEGNDTVAPQENDNEPHRFSKVPGIAPTCTDEGVLDYLMCDWCDTRDVEDKALLVIPALGHTLGEWVMNDDAPSGHHRDCGRAYGNGCERPGFVCDYREEEPHEFGEWVVTREPTVEQEGEEEHVCVVCGYTETRPIPMLPAPEPDPAPAPAPVPAPEVIADDPTPLAPAEETAERIVEEIVDDPTPLAGAAWALLNFALMNLAVYESVMLLVGYFIGIKSNEEQDKERKIQKKGLMRVLSIPVAIGSVVAFILTEDITLPVVWTDKYTPLMAAIALAQTLVVALSRKKYADEEEKKAA